MVVSTGYTQSLFLWCMGAIYFFAFSSLYFQVPGLYGRNGLLPAAKELKGTCIDSDDKCHTLAEQGECKHNEGWMMKNCMSSCKLCENGKDLPLSLKLEQKKTVLWFSPHLGLDTSSGMELICLFGMMLSSGVLVSAAFQNRLVFALLWVFYFSVYQVGQTFLWFQWDILLLETGFITILLAQTRRTKVQNMGSHHELAFWLVKWLLFRLMFQSGVVKLTSECPTWWGLTALDWHYESQCIPGPLAWYAHQLPSWFQKLSVAATFVIEIAVPFLFFSPVRSFRLWAFISQVLLQALIISTGNYNFFNLLTITLCLSLIDDDFIVDYTPSFLKKFLDLPKKKETPASSVWYTTMVFLAKTITVSYFVYWIIKAFNIRVSENGEILCDVAFTFKEFSESLPWMTQVSIYIGVISFTCHVLKYLYNLFGIDNSWGVITKMVPTTMRLIFITIIGWHFAISLVPFTSLDSNVRNDLWPIVKTWYRNADSLELVHSYGLFRRMTGVGGRPELIIEGSNNINGPWLEYNFKYKPGNLTEALPIVAPHQPRLDWQMWFAALGSYQHNPWFVHLIYKLLNAEQSVLDLMGQNPFPDKPPLYIRSRLFTYHYTKLSQETKGIVDGIDRSRRIKAWWRRDSPKEYTPPLSRNDQSLQNFVKSMGWAEKDLEEEIEGGYLYLFLRALRKLIVSLDPTLFMFLIICLSIVVRCLKR